MTPIHCDCGSTRIQVTAAENIEAFSFLSLASFVSATTLLIQFDGSAHQPSQVGGAGVVTLKANSASVSILTWQSIALVRCKDNIFAEAYACLEAVKTAEKHLYVAIQAAIAEPAVVSHPR